MRRKQGQHTETQLSKAAGGKPAASSRFFLFSKLDKWARRFQGVSGWTLLLQCSQCLVGLVLFFSAPGGLLAASSNVSVGLFFFISGSSHAVPLMESFWFLVPPQKKPNIFISALTSSASCLQQRSSGHLLLHFSCGPSSSPLDTFLHLFSTFPQSLDFDLEYIKPSQPS